MITLRSDREISRMLPAGQLVAEAHRRVAELIQPGITTAELDAVIGELFAERGAIPLFKGVPGKVPFPAATCISVNEQVVHGIPGKRVLQEGDIVSLDTGCKLDGWCGDAALTHPVGQVEPRVEKLLSVTRGALTMAIRLIGERERWSEVAQEIQTFVHRSGFSVIEEFVGHGIGREMHEDPQAPNFFNPKMKDFDLRPGLVLAIEPMVAIGRKEVRCLSDHWTQVTKDGSYSAHFEHTVAITRQGVKILTQLPD